MNAPVISTKSLQKRFGAVVAADDVSVDIVPGLTVGIIGANGAGKTTFVNMVTGYIKPDSGQILFQGADITRLSPRAVTRLGVRRSFQVAQLFPALPIRDNVMIALASAATENPSSFRPLRTRERVAEADAFLTHIGLAGMGDRATTELPQGQRKLLDIGLAMSGSPTALFLDEPTSGISAEEKFPLMDLVMEAVSGRSSTVLFVEHDMDIVSRYTHRILAFYEGRIIADGEPQEVLQHAEVRRYVIGEPLHRTGKEAPRAAH